MHQTAIKAAGQHRRQFESAFFFLLTDERASGSLSDVFITSPFCALVQQGKQVRDVSLRWLRWPDGFLEFLYF
jgi:hypothetical protein